jgi:hypothetical protein
MSGEDSSEGERTVDPECRDRERHGVAWQIDGQQQWREADEHRPAPAALTPGRSFGPSSAPVASVVQVPLCEGKHPDRSRDAEHHHDRHDPTSAACA